MTDKVALEVCESEFERFADAMDLDIDPAGMDDEDKAAFSNAKRRVIRAMQSGHLVINDNGEPVYKPQKGNTDPITFYEPQGAHRMTSDDKKEGHKVKKNYTVVAAQTQQPMKRFADMFERDLKVVDSIVVLFFG